MGGAVENETEELVLAPASIEAVDQLIEIALEVLSADTVGGPLEPGLEVAEGAVDPRQDRLRSGVVRSLDPAVVPGLLSNRNRRGNQAPRRLLLPMPLGHPELELAF